MVSRLLFPALDSIQVAVRRGAAGTACAFLVACSGAGGAATHAPDAAGELSIADLPVVVDPGSARDDDAAEARGEAGRDGLAAGDAPDADGLLDLHPDSVEGAPGSCPPSGSPGTSASGSPASRTGRSPDDEPSSQTVSNHTSE